MISVDVGLDAFCFKDHTLACCESKAKMIGRALIDYANSKLGKKLYQAICDNNGKLSNIKIEISYSNLILDIKLNTASGKYFVSPSIPKCGMCHKKFTKKNPASSEATSGIGKVWS